MAQTSWPFENIDTSETQFSQWARNIGEGVKKDTLNELAPSADSSGMNVKVASGQAMIRGHYYQSTAQETLTITAADATNDRIDNVVLELDPSANTIVLKVIAGTPAGSPVAPSLTQTDAGIYQIKLAEVYVTAASTTVDSGDVTDSRTFMQTAGDVAAELDGKVDIAVAVSEKTANYTLAATDTSDFVQVNGDYTVTVPANVFTAGERVDVINSGTGVVTFAAGSGLTLNSKESLLTLDAQWKAASVFFISATVAVLVGDLA